MSNPEPKRFTIRNAAIINRNFSGRETDFNTEGSKNFCIVLQPDEAAFLLQEGWNVKNWPPEENPEGDTRDPFLPVQLGYKIRPPRVVMVTSNGNKVSLGKDEVELLDWADITKADLVVNARYWERVGKSGIKAYVKTLVVHIEEDDLEKEYALNETPGHGEPDDGGDEV